MQNRNILISAKFYDGKRYRPHKRLKAMCDVANLVVSASDATATIAGATGGVETAWTKNPKVQFLGHLNDSQLIEQYKKSNLLLFLGWYDWCPNTVIEALSYGLPVVCGNNGGTKEIVRSNGLIVDIDREMPAEWISDNVPDVDVEMVSKKVLNALDVDFCFSREHIDIMNVAKQYYDVFKGVAR
jgi:glycosyltransferase involved in cell wall biosynthesis